jgi:membrane protease YdiL (CAAX protease family)
MADAPDDPAEPPLVLAVPPARPRPGFGEALLWCVAFLATQVFALLTVAGVVLGVLASRAADPGRFIADQLAGLERAVAPTAPDQPPRPPIPDGIGRAAAYGFLGAQVAAVGLVLLVVPWLVGPGWRRQLGVRTPAGLHVFLVVLLVPALILVADGLQELFARLTGASASDAQEVLFGTFRTVPGWVAFLAVAAGPGVVEEFWCRGLLGRGLCARYGVAAGVVLTSFLFAALHLDPSQLLIFFLMGAYLHFVYLASRSIWVPVLLHLLNNGLAILVVLSPDLLAAGERFKADARGTQAATYLAAAGLLIFATVALWTSRAEVVPTRAAGPAWEPEYPGVSTPPPGAPAAVGYARVSPAAAVLATASFGFLAYLLSRLAG